MRTFSISLLLLVGIYFLSFFSLVAQKEGMETVSQAVIRRAVAFVLPRYASFIENIAIAYEQRQQYKVANEIDVEPVDMVANISNVTRELREELWK